MHYQEKKYRINSFKLITSQLELLNLKPWKHSTSIHYYANQASNDVTKIIEYQARAVIHILDETRGRFILREKIPIENVEAGKIWLKNHGFNKISIVTMRHTDYEYAAGTIGLYTINDWLHSVILKYPAGQHEIIEGDFGLEDAEVISLPYDKYLKNMNMLNTIALT